MFEKGSIVELAGQKYKVSGNYADGEELTLTKIVPDPRIKAVVDAWNNFTMYSAAGDENRCEVEGEYCDCVNERTIQIILEAIDKIEG